MAGRPPTFDHLRSKKKPNYKKVEILLDPEFGDLVDEARNKAATAKEQLDLARELGAEETEVEKLRQIWQLAEDELSETITEANEATVAFKLQALSMKKYDDLMALHPITPEQEQKIKDRGGEPTSWNPDTFPPALIAACLVEPVLTEDQFLEIWKDEAWNANELMSLFMAALTVNSNRRDVDWGKG